MDIFKGKIVFIDDHAKSVEHYIQHLKNEGFTNVTLVNNLNSLNETLDLKADLIFLDITGVATALNEKDEGISVLEFIKSHNPWTKVIVLSGSDFPASKAKALSKADHCITKASLNFADLVNLTEQQLTEALSPEFRNAFVSQILLDKLDELGLGWYAKMRVRKILNKAIYNKGNEAFDWPGTSTKLRSFLSFSSDVAGLLSLLL